jgi:hypothetical protein
LKTKENRFLALATLVTLDDSIKKILLSSGTKCEYDFDLRKIERTCQEGNSLLTQKVIKTAILHYCDALKKNTRVISMEVENLSSMVLRVIFTLKNFDNDDLPLMDEDDLRTVISLGEWRNGAGQEVKGKK